MVSDCSGYIPRGVMVTEKTAVTYAYASKRKENRVMMMDSHMHLNSVARHDFSGYVQMPNANVHH